MPRVRGGLVLICAAAVMPAALLVSTAFARAPGDIVFERQATQTTPPAVFPHWFHRIRFRCYVCHPAIFPMQTAGGPQIKMDDIRNGKYCGVCHNGNIAWAASFDNCTRCHVGE